MRVAILEDDASQIELLSHWLDLAGHRPHAFDQGLQLLRTLEHETFDALLLDWNVPGLSGMAVLKHVRGQLNSELPVLFWTARSAETDVVEALRAGADGYLVKPVRRLELLARLEAVARRRPGEPPQPEQIEVDVFRADCQMRRLLRNNDALALTAKDFDLSVLFLRNVGRLLSRGYIRESVWKSNAVMSSRTLHTHVSRIRNKLQLTREHGWRLTAVYGHGYRLEQVKGSESRGRDEKSEMASAAAAQIEAPGSATARALARATYQLSSRPSSSSSSTSRPLECSD